MCTYKSVFSDVPFGFETALVYFQTLLQHLPEGASEVSSVIINEYMCL